MRTFNRDRARVALTENSQVRRPSRSRAPIACARGRPTAATGHFHLLVLPLMSVLTTGEGALGQGGVAERAAEVDATLPAPQNPLDEVSQVVEGQILGVSSATPTPARTPLLGWRFCILWPLGLPQMRHVYVGRNDAPLSPGSSAPQRLHAPQPRADRPLGLAAADGPGALVAKVAASWVALPAER